MKSRNLAVTLSMLFVILNLFGAMDCTFERGMDFGNKDLGNILPLSDGKYVSFGQLDVNVFEIDNDTLRFEQRLYSTQEYRASKAFGTDSLYAITQGNRLDVYVYDSDEGLSLLHSYPLASDDSLSVASEVKFFGDGFILIGAITDLSNLDVSYCQRIYILNGADAPTLLTSSYGNYANRFTQIEHINQQYYYFGYDGSLYVAPTLTNQPQLVTCPDLAGLHFNDTKVIQGSLYVLSSDSESHATLSKLDQMAAGNVETEWILSLGNSDYLTFSNISNGYVHILSLTDAFMVKVARYNFLDSLAWQFVTSHSFAWDKYQLYPFHNGYALFGNTRAYMLNNILMTQTTLMPVSSGWWCRQVFLNRYLLLQNDSNSQYKLFDIVIGQFLNFSSSGDHTIMVIREGEDKLVFTGEQILIVTLNEDGIAGSFSFTNDKDYPKGSVFDDKILVSGVLNLVPGLTLYQKVGNSVVQLSNQVFANVIDALQFYDADHFATLESNPDFSDSLKLYRIEPDYSFSLIASYHTTGSDIYVNRNILSADATHGFLLDLSDPDNPVEVPHNPNFNYACMSFNGLHNYMQIYYNVAYIFDDTFQYTGFIDSFYAHFVGGNKVVIVGQACAVIVTLDDIVANPQEDNPAVTMPELVLSNAPNPFISGTAISFTLPKSAHVNLTIYNLKGQKVVKLNDSKFKKGDYKLHWDGTDSNHRKVCSGLYFARLITGKSTSTRKMILIK